MPKSIDEMLDDYNKRDEPISPYETAIKRAEDERKKLVKQAALAVGFMALCFLPLYLQKKG